MRANNSITDYDRFVFMQKLAAEVREKGLLLDQWEENFLNTWRRSSQPSSWFIGERPKAADRMWQKYSTEIALPFPAPAENVETIEIPAADPGCCEYRVQDSGRQSRCNEPAVFQRKSGFRYCGQHAGLVQETLRKRGEAIYLFPINNQKLESKI